MNPNSSPGEVHDENRVKQKVEDKKVADEAAKKAELEKQKEEAAKAPK